MEMMTYPGDLKTLRQQLQSYLNDIPITIQCALRDEHLVVLGQHQDDVALDTTHILQVLERQIQMLHLRFTQQVRLYLRIHGNKHPYAHHWFAIQPPPPPLIQRRPQSDDHQPQDSHAQIWIDDDDPAETVLDQLASFRYSDPSGSRSPDSKSSAQAQGGAEDDVPPTILTLQESSNPLSALHKNWQTWQEEIHPAEHGHPDPAFPSPQQSPSALQLVPSAAKGKAKTGIEQWGDRLDTKLGIALSITALGVTGGLYGSSRRCMIGECPELQIAQASRQGIAHDLQDAETWRDLEVVQDSISQAISLLEPIPIWSPHARKAQPLAEEYADQAAAIEQLMEVERIAEKADDIRQKPIYTLEDWNAVRSLWETTIVTLEAIPAHSDLYEFAQQQLQTHRQEIDQIDQQIRIEETALSTLNIAKETAQLAQARQHAAQSPEDWQLVRATWKIALDQLYEVPRQSIAAVDAQRLLGFYVKSLEAADQRIAEGATSPTTSSENAFPSEEVVPTPVNSQLAQQVETELNSVCTGELQACRLIAIEPTIRVQLDSKYLEAIALARNSNNATLRAIASHHRQLLQQKMEDIAQQFQRPLEVYNPDQTLFNQYQPVQAARRP